MGASAFIDEFLHTYLGGEFYPDHPSPIGTYFLNTLQRTRAGTYRTVLKQVTLEHDLQMEVPTALVGIITNSEEVTRVEGQNLAKDLSVFYYETQPSNKENIARIFCDLIALSTYTEVT